MSVVFKQYQLDFMDLVGAAAKADYNNSKILPSITVAQAIRESAYGTSELAVAAKNLFGIKVGTGWTGPVYNINTKESYDQSTYVTVAADFRVYDSWEASIIDHALFLQKARYAAVISETDFVKAAFALKQAGYATGIDYDRNVTMNIVDYQLYKYDTTQINLNKAYKIQVGSYATKAEATTRSKAIYNATAISTKVVFCTDGKYRVQVGVFSNKTYLFDRIKLLRTNNIIDMILV